MKKIVMEGPRKSRVIDIEIPKIDEDELLVRVTYTGMCHSEWYGWANASAGESFGHEPIGVVADVGRNVNGFKIGDRVSGLGGGYQEYIVMRPEYTVHVPEGLSDEDAIAEPLSCMMSAASKMVPALPGETIAVVGAGYMGLGMISLFRLMGYGKIIAVDTRFEARENALKWGADEAYTPEEIPEGYVLDWKRWGGNDLSSPDKPTDIFHTGFNKVMEFTGTETGLRLAGDLVSAHGVLGIGGYHNDIDRLIDFKLWNVKAFTAINCHERRLEYQTGLCQQALELLSSGKWNFKGLTSRVYDMDEFDRANDDMETKRGGFLKGVVSF